MSLKTYSYLLGTTHTIRLNGLRNGILPGFVNTAIVTIDNLRDTHTNALITGQTFPLTLDYVQASNGCYQATLEYDLNVVVGQRLFGTMLIDSGAGVQRKLTVHMIVESG